MLIKKRNLERLIKDFLRENEDKNKERHTGNTVFYWNNTDNQIDYAFDWKILADKKVVPSSDADMIVGKCEQNHCSQWVSDSFGREIRIGNAWHADRLISDVGMPIIKYASHHDPEYVNDNFLKHASWCFTRINENPNKQTMLEKTKELSKSLIPDQSKFSNLALGDIVGLYFESSSNFSKAFFESATGYTRMGSGDMETPAEYFVTESGEPWKQEMLGENIQFKPSSKLTNSKIGFPINTHIGVVGAIHNGIPIIYHNVHRNVHAVGLNAIDQSEIKIFWSAKKS